MIKMVVVVKCQFLATLTEKLHQFALINPIKIHEEIEELAKSYPAVKSAYQYLSWLKFDSLSNMSCTDGHFAVV